MAILGITRMFIVSQPRSRHTWSKSMLQDHRHHALYGLGYTLVDGQETVRCGYVAPAKQGKIAFFEVDTRHLHLADQTMVFLCFLTCHMVVGGNASCAMVETHRVHAGAG